MDAECSICGEELPSVDRVYCSRSCSGKSGRRDGVRFAEQNGYHVWTLSGKINTTTSVHQLVAVSNGADPSKVYGNDNYSVDHVNGCRLDNRPENIRLLNVEEHGRKDSQRHKKIYTNKDVLKIIESIYDTKYDSPKHAIEEIEQWL